MKNKFVLKLLLTILGLVLLATPLSRAKASDAQIYLVCSTNIMPDNQWLDIDQHLLYQDFPIRDGNLLMNSVGVRLYAREPGILVYAEIYNDSQQFVKKSGRFVPQGNNWVYFNFGDTPIPQGDYHLWIWTNDGTGVYWGHSNDGNCDYYSSASVNLRTDNNKDMAFALYVKSANSPVTLQLFPGLTNLQIAQPSSSAPAQGTSGSGTPGANNPANPAPAPVPPSQPPDGDPNATSNSGNSGSATSSSQSTQNSGGIVSKIKNKIAQVVNPNSKSSSTWQQPTDDEILRMTYGDDYKTKKPGGLLSGSVGTILLMILFLGFILFFLAAIVVIVIIIIRRRNAKNTGNNPPVKKS